MTQTAPSFNQSRIEALMPLMRGWLIWFASAVLVLVERSNSRHRRLLKPFVLRLERNLANWLFLSAHFRITPAPLTRRTSRPRSAPRGFCRVCASATGIRRLVRIRAHASLAPRLRYMIDIASNPERHIARLMARLWRDAATSHLVAVAPPMLALAANALALAPAFTDSS